MILAKCENCKTRSFYPKKRYYHFGFLPMKGEHSEDKLCRLCFKKVIYMIKRTHNELPILSKPERSILAYIARKMTIKRTVLLEHVGLTIQLRKL